MRPRKLVIEAFGPFCGETVVDFDRMGSGVFLIAGDTGAGKTSIFDAMMFALYLEASGDGRSALANEELYNNVAKKEAKRRNMRVEFSFSCKGHEYTIERRAKWGQSGTAGKMAAPESKLVRDGEIIAVDNKKGKGNTPDKVTGQVIGEILCLNALQFRQIIMLAQGEFQRFLEASGKERGDILGKLYDNRRQKDMEERLRALKNYLKTKVDRLTAEEEIKFGELDFADCRLESYIEDERFRAHHPELLEILAEMLEKTGERLKEFSQSKTEAGAKRENLLRKETAARQNNEVLERLQKAEAEADALNKQTPQHEALAQRLELARAAGKVVQAEENAQRAAAERQKTEAELNRLNSELKRAEEVREEKIKAAETAKAEYEPKISDNMAEVKRLKELYPKYDELDKCLREGAEKKRTAEAAARELKKVKDEAEKNEAAIREQAEILTKLKEAGEAAVKLAEGKRNELAEKYKSLTGLQKKRDELVTLQNDIRTKEKELWQQREKAQKAEEKHLCLNKRFLAGQTAILAAALKEKIAQKGEASCPVCGTVHRSVDSVAFADESREKVPTEAAVKSAYEGWQKEQKQADSIETELKVIKNTQEINLKNFLDEAERLIAVRDEAKLLETELIAGALADCRKAGEKAGAELNRARTDYAARQNAEAMKKQLEEKAEELKSRQEQADEKKRLAEQSLTELRAQLKARQEALQGQPESKKAAVDRANRLDTEAGQYRQKIDIAERERQRAIQKAENLNGTLTEKANTLQEQRKKEEKAQEVFIKALQDNHFADEAAYRRAMAPDGAELTGRELDKWITLTDGEIRHYRDECQNMEGTLKAVRSAAAGKEFVDLESLNGELAAANKAFRQVDEELNRLANKAALNKERFADLKKLRSELKSYRQAESEAGPLAETATDRNKQPFESYVLEDFFRSILDRANVHLVRMNDGVYTLGLYRDGSGTKKEEALNLGVRYAVSDQPHKCAALSGGQKFEASLALAIGLSDVVQLNSASAINIDSMFIDEGFGSLDDMKLDSALRVLQELSGGQRQIGIISHVDRLEECLTKKIRVSASKEGSRIEYETE